MSHAQRLLSRVFGIATFFVLFANCSVGAEDKSTVGKQAAFAVDIKESHVKWIGRKVTGSHDGTIDIQKGELMAMGSRITGGTIVLDMTSIKNLDLENADSNAKLTGHLKSDDFFSVEKHPAATFTILKVTPIPQAKAGEPNSEVTGRLVIKGITHPLSFRATILKTDGAFKASAQDVRIDRTLYDIRYGSGKFFENLGDKVIDDHFTVNFDITAKK